MVDDDILLGEDRTQQLSSLEKPKIFSLRQFGLLILGAMFTLLIILILSKVFDVINTMDLSTSVSQDAVNTTIILNSGEKHPIVMKTPETDSKQEEVPPLPSEKTTIQEPVEAIDLGNKQTELKPSIDPLAIKDADEILKTEKALVLEPAKIEVAPIQMTQIDSHKSDSNKKNKDISQPQVIVLKKESQPHSVHLKAVQKPKSENLSVLEKKIMQKKLEHYTLQIIATHDELKLKKFMNEMQIQEKSYYYRTLHQGKPWYVLVYGDYENKAAALAAVGALPLQIQSQKPWVRKYASIQESLRVRK